MGPCHLTGGPGRRPGGDAVVDHDRRPTDERRPRAAAPKTPGPPLELGSFRSLHGCHLVLADPGHGEHLTVEDPHAVLADRAHAELRLIRHTELANDDHIERRIQLSGDLERNRHPAPRQAEHDHLLVAEAPPSVARPAPARVCPVPKHDHPPTVHPCRPGR